MPCTISMHTHTQTHVLTEECSHCRAMEFVNIPLLYDNIRAAMKKYKPSVQEHHDLQLMRYYPTHWLLRGINLEGVLVW